MRRLKEEARKKKPELKLKTMVGKDEHTAATAATRWNPITGERYGHGSARPTNFSKRDTIVDKIIQQVKAEEGLEFRHLPKSEDNPDLHVPLHSEDQKVC